MTFVRADELRATSNGALVGGHLLDVQRLGGPDGLLRWQLRCGGCLALLDAGELDRHGPLLVGASALQATGGCAAVSWVYGAWPSAAASGSSPLSSAAAGRDSPQPRGQVVDRVDVVFGRGLRRPVLAPAHALAGGMWVAAAPGRARQVITLSPGTGGVQRRVDRLAVSACAGLQGVLA